MATVARKNGRGRQKVKMEKMENKSNLRVTFSKRRCGLFKKASELCTLTDAEIAIIVHSPGRKVFSFGHPAVHKIVDKTFPDSNNIFHRFPNNHNDERLVEAHKNASILELNMHLSMLDLQIESEKKQNVILAEKERAERAKFMWEEPIENLSVNQLREMAATLEDVKAKVVCVGSKVAVESYNSAAQAMNNQMYQPSMNVMGYGYVRY